MNYGDSARISCLLDIGSREFREFFDYLNRPNMTPFTFRLIAGSDDLRVDATHVPASATNFEHLLPRLHFSILAEQGRHV